ncbi:MULTISPECIES: DUF3592 domain-containing protein [Cellulomonas]|uniref:DUF3592 domain-containing protein n=1 Tax=Cellulomonas TaxID=1707 RepID=UPI0010A8BD9F|nr:MULTISPECIES: DUF3592 domain-containing protein [Cellulomonas]
MPVVLVVQVVLVVAAAALAVPAVLARRDATRTRRRLARARTASGEVVAVTEGAGGVVPTVRYFVGGERLEGVPRTPRPGARYLVSQPVDVRYDPQDPAWMTVEAVPGDARPPRAPRARASAAVAAVLLAAALLLQLLR